MGLIVDYKLIVFQLNKKQHGQRRNSLEAWGNRYLGIAQNKNSCPVSRAAVYYNHMFVIILRLVFIPEKFS